MRQLFRVKISNSASWRRVQEQKFRDNMSRPSHVSQTSRYNVPFLLLQQIAQQIGEWTRRKIVTEGETASRKRSRGKRRSLLAFLCQFELTVNKCWIRKRIFGPCGWKRSSPWMIVVDRPFPTPAHSSLDGHATSTPLWEDWYRWCADNSSGKNKMSFADSTNAGNAGEDASRDGPQQEHEQQRTARRATSNTHHHAQVGCSTASPKRSVLRPQYVCGLMYENSLADSIWESKNKNKKKARCVLATCIHCTVYCSSKSGAYLLSVLKEKLLS